MKTSTRTNCFETNSSSQHTIVITKDDTFLTKEEVEDMFRWGKHRMYTYDSDDLDFGRAPFNVLSSLEDKTWFAIASYCQDIRTSEALAFVSKIEKIIRSVYPEFGGIDIPTYDHQIYTDKTGEHEIHPNDLNYVGSEKIKLDDGSVEYITKYTYTDDNGKEQEAVPTNDYGDFPYFGSIDHQSAGLLQSFLNKNNITLKDFLMNKKYQVIIDGDEYCIFISMIENHLIDTKNIATYPNRSKGEDYDA